MTEMTGDVVDGGLCEGWFLVWIFKNNLFLVVDFFAEVLDPAIYLMSDTVVYCISIADNAVDG